MNKQDVYAEVTERIIAALEAGTVPWVCPWNKAEAARYGAGDALPYNATSKRAYSGINVILLWLFGPPGRPAYMTYKQAEALGAKVRMGSKGFRIVYADHHRKTVTNPDTGEAEDASYFFLKRHTVFHVSQIDGLPDRFAADVDPPAYAPLTDSAFNVWVANTGADIRPGGTRAFYSPAIDYIGMPPLQTFESEEHYKATLLHELTHWTRHKSRLNREKLSGVEAYAKEELVAEIGAAFLCAQLGIEGQLRHAEYIGSWIKALKNDNKAIFRAAAAAQKAADYLQGLQRVEVPRSRALVPYVAPAEQVHLALAA